MPFAEKERQREYQRDWVSKRKRLNQYGSNTIYKLGNFDLRRESVNLKSAKANIGSLKTWAACVNHAHKILTMRKVNRLQLAEIAVRGCIIKHGGKLTNGLENLTLKSFAIDCGIHPKTLHEWVRVKRTIVDKLPKKTKEVNWTAAQVALKKSSSCSVFPMVLYRQFLTPKGRSIVRGMQYIDYMVNFETFLINWGKTMLPASEAKRAKKAAKGILKCLGA